jgi:phospholipid/cholesterol/gamma-HCH transport system substrate-binding protein
VKRLGVWARLAALVVIALMCLYYVLFDVVQVTVGAQPFQVKMMLSSGGGIFPHAVVSYRGVQIGNVTAVQLHTDGVEVHMAIKSGTKVPAGSPASVSALSAAGEQYVDFVPTTSAGPYLHGGSVIPVSQTHLPVTVGQVLTDLGLEVSRLKPGDLNTVTNELATALAGTGTQLSDDLNSIRNIFDSLRQAEPATLDLLQTGAQVLNTIASSGAEFNQFSQGLAQLTGQLKASDPDIQALIANGTGAVQQTNQLLQQTGQNLRSMFGSLAAIGNIAAARLPAIYSLLGILPSFGAQLAGVAQGTALQIAVGVNSTLPGLCTYANPSQLPTTTNTAAADLSRYCATSAIQRGAFYAPRPSGDTTAVPVGAGPATGVSAAAAPTGPAAAVAPMAAGAAGSVTAAALANDPLAGLWLGSLIPK